MERNAHGPNDLREDERQMDAPAPPPFTLTPLGPDPSLGWSGWGWGSMAGWVAAQAVRTVREDPRREPRSVEPR